MVLPLLREENIQAFKVMTGVVKPDSENSLIWDSKGNDLCKVGFYNFKQEKKKKVEQHKLLIVMCPLSLFTLQGFVLFYTKSEG